MATSVTLPALGESVTEGTVTRWLKQPGDRVEVDEPLLEVSTDKVDTEIPSPVAGTLIEIKVQEDETVEVGAELATVGDEGESAGSGGGDEDTSAQETAEAGQAEGDAGPGEGVGGAPGEEAAPSDDEVDRQTEPQGDVPQAQTDSAGPAQETAPGPADTKPEVEASREGTKTGGGGTPVTLPALGESVTEGTVTRWLKQVGDSVAVDEALLEVSTDKVDTEIPSPVAGTVLEIKVQEDETVEVGAELAIVGSGEAAAQPAEEAPATPEPAAEPEPAQKAEAKDSDLAEARDKEAAEEQSQMRKDTDGQAQQEAPAPQQAEQASRPSRPRPRSRPGARSPATAPTSRRSCGRWRPTRVSTSRR